MTLMRSSVGYQLGCKTLEVFNADVLRDLITGWAERHVKKLENLINRLEHLSRHR